MSLVDKPLTRLYNRGEMAKRKYPSELNTKQVRVSLGDYALLREISLRAGVTMAEALHLALERQEVVTRVSPAQIPMPALRVTGMPTIRVVPVTVTAVNGAGAKHSAFVIKPKGGVIHE
jgi:hypothetical protein